MNFKSSYQALGQVTPQQKYEGVAEKIKERREELKKRALERREKVNKLREVVQP